MGGSFDATGTYPARIVSRTAWLYPLSAPDNKIAPRRIYYLSASAIPSKFANSVHVMKMCHAMAKQGHDVHLFARGTNNPSVDPFGEYDCDNLFEIHFCGQSELSFFGRIRYAFAVARKTKSLGPADLLYARHIFSLALHAARGIPMVFEAHVLPKSRWGKFVHGWIFARRNFRKLVTISEALRKDCLETFPHFKPETVFVAHDAADPLAHQPVRPQSQTSRIQLGYVGSLFPGKGMEMIETLAQRMPDADFHVIGGQEKDLEHWTSRINGPNVRFHGFVPHKELSNAYTFFDVALAPLQNRVATISGTDDIARWTSPLKLFEYMAHGKAIICSNLPVLREILVDGSNALLVPPDDADAWQTAIRKLASDPVLCRQLAEAAMSDVANHHNWDTRAKVVLGQICDRHQTGTNYISPESPGATER